MEFPNYETWLKDVLNPADTEWWDFRTPEWYEYYKNKHRICKAFNPMSILEVGVRFGYSAHAFITAAPVAVYTGVDSNDPKHGGWKTPTLEWALAMLSRTCDNLAMLDYPSEFSILGVTYSLDSKIIPNNHGIKFRRFIVADTQCLSEALKIKIKSLNHDFIHIDADHSYKGCLSDLRTFWPVCNKVMLVDDYDCPSVKQAVDQFTEENDILKFYMPSLRGEALLIK